VTPEEYAAKQAVISAAIANFIVQFAQFITQRALSPTEWVSVLKLIFPEVSRRRDDAAELGRQFYDYQRALAHPELPRNEVFLETYDFDRFVKSMDPARQLMSQADSQNGIVRLALQAVREVENAGRQQIIHAVQEDPATQILRGWARVATGRETCAWCLMLVSRGPTYLGADTAGLDLDDTSAQRMIAAGEDVSEYMEQWHSGCDCKVIPVFRQQDWVGKEAADRALELWIDATKVAQLSRKLGPSIKKSGKDKGRELTLNEETINVLRSMLDTGEINPAEYAALAA
jgi:hypothetical protein